MGNQLKSLVLISLSLLIASCASVDFDYPKQTSYAIEPDADTYIGGELAKYPVSFPAGYSGFYPLPDSIAALSARLLMAARAERTIDAQYYLVKDDVVGNAFLKALLDAADRGVRVRLLVDDMFTEGHDLALAALDSHPNFEIRIFNPFANRAARIIDSLTSLSRINRRMHNKSFTVDNQITVVGGRNIADEYFGARSDAKFSDLDVLGIGPFVNDVSNSFDDYWNHERSVPVTAFVKIPDDTAALFVEIRQQLEENNISTPAIAFSDAVFGQILQFDEDHTSAWIWAPYELVADSPDKSIKSQSANAPSITTHIRESLLSAQREVIVVSPYFVLHDSIIDEFIAARQKGIDITVITNSLAATNQLVVHGGYAPIRKPLLKGGIRIFEVRDDTDVSGAELVAASGAKATLHTKAFAVDRKKVFIGSFNFDPRSASINTEMGVIIDSPELTERLLVDYEEKLMKSTFEVYLNDREQLRWRGYDDEGNVEIHKTEPHAPWGQRFIAGFLTLLPIRGQL